MPATISQILALGELGLSLQTPRDLGHLDAPVQWAHSSDLVDPTPFLSAGHLLLTTAPPPEAESYVHRLVARGVVALGFGTEVVRAGTPENLIAACTRHELPLFEVPYDTPFIAIARFVADRVAEDSFARSTWALGASRAISLAALHTDPLPAIVTELAHQINETVVLIGVDATPQQVHPSGSLSVPCRAALMTAADTLLHSHRRGADSVVTDDGVFSLQTIGTAGRLRGVLAVGGTRGDAVTQQVVTGVVALIGLALEQGRATLIAESRLRTAVWRALVAGDVTLARALAEPVLGPLPKEPVRLTALTGPSREAAADWLALEQVGFVALDDDEVIIIDGADTSESTPVSIVVTQFDLWGGVSAPSTLENLPTALTQARLARKRARVGSRVPAFESVTNQGILSLLHTDDASALAHAQLRPVFEADPDLPRVLRTWLDNNAVYDVAARVLGMHRHTLRARITEAERLLERDLTSFEARANLYATLLTAEVTAPGKEHLLTEHSSS